MSTLERCCCARLSLLAPPPRLSLLTHSHLPLDPIRVLDVHGTRPPRRHPWRRGLIILGWDWRQIARPRLWLLPLLCFTLLLPYPCRGRKGLILTSQPSLPGGIDNLQARKAPQGVAYRCGEREGELFLRLFLLRSLLEDSSGTTLRNRSLSPLAPPLLHRLATSLLHGPVLSTHTSLGSLRALPLRGLRRHHPRRTLRDPFFYRWSADSSPADKEKEPSFSRRHWLRLLKADPLSNIC